MKKKILIGLLVIALLAIGTAFITTKITSNPIKVEEIFRARQYPNIAIMHISPTNTAKLNYTYQIETWKSNVLRHKVNVIFTTHSIDDFTGSGKIQLTFPLTNEEIAQYSFKPRAFELDASRSEDLGKYFETRLIDNNKTTILEPSKDKSQTPVQDVLYIVGGVFLVGRGGSIGGGGGEDVIVVHKTNEDTYEIHAPRQRQIFQEPCPNCHGTGWWDERHGVTCSECHGSGISYVEKD